MFADYKLRVIEEFRIKKATDGIPLNLIHASPAKLKAECLAVFDTRFLKKDEKVLISFFGQRKNEFEYRQAIKQCEADRFKPLCNYLRESTRNTDERNIELLAWLINFEPRPYPINGLKLIKESNDQINAASFGRNADERKFTTNKVKLGRISSLWAVPLVLIVATYVIWHYSEVGVTPPRFPITGQEQCMFWTGDHYQPILCSQHIDNTPVYALDKMKVAKLKLIKKTDTISKKAIGHVWYAKINRKIEFYTSDGYHPVYTSRRLRPMSLYIYTKYILDK
jgi:hypothetical protein